MSIELTDGAAPEMPALPPDLTPELRALASELKLMEANIILARTAFARATGFTFDQKRDTWGVLGYRDLISTADFRAKYQRGGIAGRIVDALPNATWRGSMELIEDETKDDYTPFEQAWADFDKRLQVQAKLRRVDKLAGLSTFAILLIGTPDGNLEVEMPKGPGTADASKKIIYLTPFAGGGSITGSAVQHDRTLATGSDATVFEYDLDTKSPRFGLPRFYQLRRADIASAIPRPVHWSRIIHVAEELLDDEVFGIPSLERVWNLLEDLDKVTGGGAEAFWLRANQGIHIDVDKDMSLAATQDTVSALKEQMEAYKHQLTRAFRTRGTTISTLGSDVANFGPSADAILTQIAGAKGIPKRILTGSEMGELASSQDRDNWKDQINGRQESYVGPYIVRQLVDRLIAFGYMPAPAKGVDTYTVKWPHIQTLTDQEKADGAQKWAEVNATANMTVFTDAEIRDKWYGMAPTDADQEDTQPWRSALALKMAEVNKTQGAVIFTDDEIRKTCFDWEPLTPEEKVPLTAPERVSAPAPTPAIDAQGKSVAPPAVAAPVKPVPKPLVKAASAYTPQPGDEELVAVLAEALEAGNADVVLEILGDAPGHEFHGNQYTSDSGAAGGRKGENFVKKAHEPESYGSHYKNLNKPEEANTLFEQSHAALEKQGYKRDNPSGLPFQYQRDATFTHPETGAKARLSKAYFGADPRSKAQGAKGVSRVKLEIKTLGAGPYKLSSTQVDLPLALAKPLLDFGNRIPERDLYESEGGRETEPHVTVKYGLPADADVPQLAGFGPVTLSLGKTDMFATPDYDVLFASVDSPDLVRLNSVLGKTPGVTDTHPNYQPHATIAYMKSGTAAAWVGLDVVKGLAGNIISGRGEITVKSITFAKADGTKTAVSLV